MCIDLVIPDGYVLLLANLQQTESVDNNNLTKKVSRVCQAGNVDKKKKNVHVYEWLVYVY